MSKIAGQDPTQYLLMLAAVLVIVAIAVYYVVGASGDYKVKAGKLIGINYPDDDLIVLSFEDGTVMAFERTNHPFIIGATYRIEYRSFGKGLYIDRVMLISLNGGR